MKMPKVAIVGWGMSSVYAVLACRNNGITPDVYMRRPGINPGAFWLKWLPYPWSDRIPKFYVNVFSVGTRELYIRKQWGDVPENYKSSFPDKPFVEEGYDPQDLLDEVSNEGLLFKGIRVPQNFSDDDLDELGIKYDLVFHSFPSQKFWGSIDKNYIVRTPVISSRCNTPSCMVMYDGTSDYFVRTGYLFRRIFREFSLNSVNDKVIQGVYNFWDSKGMSPTISNLTEIRPEYEGHYPERIAPNIVPIGRLACMNRTMLSHDAYRIVDDMLKV